MLKTTTQKRIASTAVLALASAAAQAHPGHGAEGLAAGLAHPFMGLDHLLAMLAVGLWSSAVLPQGRRLIGPLLFVALLPIGALFALEGYAFAQVESAVALSVALLGALLFAGRRLPQAAGFALIAIAALLHGQAHGMESAVEGPAFVAYAAGFMLSSALLHAAGLAAGTGLQRVRSWAWPATAALIGASGLVMLASRV